MDEFAINYVNPTMFRSDEKRCGICGSEITEDDLFHLEEPDIWYHDDLQKCIIELQHIVLSQRKVIKMLKAKIVAVRLEFINFARGLYKTKWGLIAKAKILAFEMQMKSMNKRSEA